MGQAVPERRNDAVPQGADQRTAGAQQRSSPAPDAETRRVLGLLRGVLDRLPE